MSKKMLIDASQPEETRVVVVEGTRVDELDFESANKRQLRGNVYLARVTRVEPSLQAAFIEYGGNRHGFLAFSEIHPDYYQIPYEDRMALIEAEEAANLEDDASEEDEATAKTANDSSESDDTDPDDDVDSPDNDDEDVELTDAADTLIDDQDGEENEDDEIEDEIEKTASTRRRKISHRRYKIQEVIKRGQILLIQVVKEERGNKGAAMTTYLSLAGRYCVLMPNTPRGGGISRKIANGSDRKRLKAIVSEFEVPHGMGVIVRTAGAKRTKSEIKRDFDYLSRLWETIRTTTLESIAPSLIYEEGNLVKRSIRDLYNKDINEILVQGEESYKVAKDFIKMLMPSHAKNVKSYKESIPLFLRYNVEKQIEQSLDPVVQLKSGGYLVIHPTEALVSIDVNSGRSTKERNVERTALKTNLEAAEEVARQMRLRDLAGLIVIDFIDMEENRNNRAVERRMKDVLSHDRARVQAGRISQFGLMEISRQRRRRSLLEGSTINCPHCNGVGRERTIESLALKILRTLEEMGVRRQAKRIRLSVSPEVGGYLLNHKRAELNSLEAEFDTFVEIKLDENRIRLDFDMEVLEKPSKKEKDPLIKIEEDIRRENDKAKKAQKVKTTKDDATKSEEEDDDTKNAEHDEHKDGEPRKRRRRGRRGGRRRRSNNENKANSDSQQVENSDAEIDPAVSDETGANSKEKPKKGRRRRSAKGDAVQKTYAQTENAKSDDMQADDIKASTARADNGKVEDSKTKNAKSVSKTRRKAPTKAKATESDKKSSDKKSSDKKPSSAAEKKAATAKSSKKDSAKSAVPAKSTTRRKAPSKPVSKEKAAQSDVKSADKAKSEISSSTRRRKAPARKTTKVENIDQTGNDKTPSSTKSKPLPKAKASKAKVSKAKAAISKTVKAKPESKSKPAKKPQKKTAPKATPSKSMSSKSKSAKSKSAVEVVEKTLPSKVPVVKTEIEDTPKKKRGGRLGWWQRRKS